MDSEICGHWQERLRRYFDAKDVEARYMAIPGGERSKNMEAVMSIVAELHQYGLDRRNEPPIVMGGGAVLDTGSFAASIYRRGVPFIRVPTTLLGYVDASVGIKTGVNVGSSKNLIGTFSAPELVLLDREFFGSLAPCEVASGLAEVLKLGLGCDTGLFRMLDAGAPAFASTRLRDSNGFKILARAIDVMLDQLQPNIYEGDLSRPLDLGHTFSQPLEMSGDGTRVRHGEAVAFDLNLSAIISARRGVLSADELRRLADLTRRLGLSTTVPDIDPQVIWESLTERTQHRAGEQRTPLPRRIGECMFVNDLTRREICDAFEQLRDNHFRH
jgi:2-epi-5-epi-valiolone synthase